MSKNKTRTDFMKWEEDTQDWLMGRRKPGVRDVLAAIHAINPTDRKMADEEKTRRYGLKSRLQSLLIRFFGPELTANEEEPGLVLLTHRSSGMSAGHCRMEELEEDARSWLRFQLDVGAGTPEPVASIAGGRDAGRSSQSQDEWVAVDEEASPRDLIKAGRHALDEYDYDLARQCFEQALARSGGSPQAAVPLLELLVDALAAYQDALNLIPSLPEPCMQNEDVRALLALAALRAGDDEQAGVLAFGLSCPRVADVFCSLAQRALERGDARNASVALMTLVQRGMVHPDLPLLEKTVGELKRQVLAPLEQELDAIAQHGTPQQLEEKARAILDEWPDCKGARAVLERLESEHAAQVAQQRAQQARRVLEQVKTMDMGADPNAALTLLEEAQKLDANAPGLADLLRQAREACDQRAQETQVERVVHLLEQDGQVAEGLLEFLALDKAARQRVRARVSGPEAGFAEDVASKSKDAKPRAVVNATLALSKAAKAVAAGQDAEASQLLNPHAELLRLVSAAAHVHMGIQQRSVQRERIRVESLLDQAQSDLDRGSPELARQTLDRLNAELPDEALTARAQHLRGRIARFLRLNDHYLTFQAHQDGEDPLSARQAAEDLAGLADQDEERARWTEVARLQDARLTTQWRIRVARVPEGGVAHGIADLNWYGLFPGTPDVQLTADGRELVERRVCGRWQFLKTLDIASSRVTGGMWMRMPTISDASATLHMSGEHVLLCTGSHKILFLRHRSWRIERQVDTKSWRGPDSTMVRHLPIPRSQFHWINDYQRDLNRYEVFDLVDGKRVRAMSSPGNASILPTRQGFRVLLLGAGEEKPRIHFPDGQVDSLRVPDDVLVGCIVEHPGCHGWLVVTRECGLKKGRQWQLVELGESFPTPVFHTLVGADGYSCTTVAVPSERCVHVFNKVDDEVQVFTVGPTLAPGDVTSQRVAGIPVIFMNEDASTMVSPVMRGDVLQFIPVGRDAASLPTGNSPPWSHLKPELAPPFFSCRDGSMTDSDLNNDLQWELDRQRTDGERSAWIHYTFEKHKENADELTELCSVTHLEVADASFRDILHRALELHPRHPALLMIQATNLIEGKDYVGAREVLNRVATEDLPRAQMQHLLHLKGIVQIRLGNLADAAELWRTAATQGEGKHCPLDGCLALVHAMQKALGPEDLEPSAPVVVQFWAVLNKADTLLGTGDHAAALRVLDRPVIHDAVELQSLGRLVWSHLNVPAQDDVARMSKAHALAQFCSLTERKKYTGAWNVPFGAREWSLERLREVAARAAEWLEGDQDGYPV